jgi:hypothetical protein
MSLALVEFAGPPGSGKSTLAARLAGHEVAGRVIVPVDQLLLRPRRGLGPLRSVLTRRGVRARLARSGRLRYLLLRPDDGAARPDDAWGPVMRALEGHPLTGPRADARYRESARAWLRTTAALVDAAGRSDADVIPLMEEGLVQRALTVLGAEPALGPLDALLDRRPTTTLLVHLCVPDAVLVERALLRSREGRAPALHRGLDDREIVALVRQDALAIARIVERCAERGAGVIALDDDGTDPGRRVDAVLEAVRERLSAG